MMQSISKNNWKEWWGFGLLVCLLIGLMVSRAMVSFASVLMVVPFFFSFSSIKRVYWIAIGLLLFPVVLSGLWSDDKMLWWNSVSIKLPLLTMMLGLCSISFPAIRWRQLVFIFLLTVLAGCCWSLSQYSFAVQEAYLQAKTLPTPMDNDHIRFSWLVCIAVFLGMYVVSVEKNKTTKTCIVVVVVILVSYLHILAAKTGLACLYGGGIIYFLYATIVQGKWKRGLLVVGLITAMAFVFFKTTPTLQNRVQYVLYDFENYSRGNSMPGYNDAARWLSIRAGYAIMNEHPATGVGAGDVLGETNTWHNTHHPQSLAYERFLPANEWLVYGAAAGWPGLLFFTGGLLLLLYSTTSKSAWSFALSITTFIPFLVDDTLEGQYGVVILAFIAFFGQQKLTERNA